MLGVNTLRDRRSKVNPSDYSVPQGKQSSPRLAARDGMEQEPFGPRFQIRGPQGKPYEFRLLAAGIKG
jgi:hypothetical protein